MLGQLCASQLQGFTFYIVGRRDRSLLSEPISSLQQILQLSEQDSVGKKMERTLVA